MVRIMHLQTTSWMESMLRITTEKKRGKTILSVEGRLAGPWVAALEQCWRDLQAGSPGRKLPPGLFGGGVFHAARRIFLDGKLPHGGTLHGGVCPNQRT